MYPKVENKKSRDLVLFLRDYTSRLYTPNGDFIDYNLNKVENEFKSRKQFLVVKRICKLLMCTPYTSESMKWFLANNKINLVNISEGTGIGYSALRGQKLNLNKRLDLKFPGLAENLTKYVPDNYVLDDYLNTCDKLIIKYEDQYRIDNYMQYVTYPIPMPENVDIIDLGEDEVNDMLDKVKKISKHFAKNIVGSLDDRQRKYFHKILVSSPKKLNDTEKTDRIRLIKYLCIDRQ